MRHPSRPVVRKCSRSYPGFVEPLEDRIAPAYVGVFSGPANGKTLTLTGDNAGHLLNITTGGTSFLSVQDVATSIVQSFDLTGVVSIVVAGGAVQDTVNLYTDVATSTRSVSFDGGAGADLLVFQGTSAVTATDTIGTTANSGSVATGGGAIAYSNVGYAAFFGIGTLSVNSSPGADNYTLNGNVLESAAGPRQQLIFNQIPHLSLNFGAGDVSGVADAVTVTSLPSSIADLTIQMGDGNDVVAFTPSVDSLPTGLVLKLDGGAGVDAFTISTDSNPTLTDASFAFQKGATQYSVALNASFEVANITGGASANTFTVTGWSGSGSLDGQGGSDTLVAVNDVPNFGLSDSQFTRTGMGALALASIETANLTGGVGSNTFTVSGFSGSGSFDGVTGFGYMDTIAVTQDVAKFTLTDSSLTRSGLGTLTLARIRYASLSGGAGGNTFDISGWSSYGQLDGLGGIDTVVATNDIMDFVLTDTSLGRSILYTFTLANIEKANLTGGDGANRFFVSGWSGGGTLDGLGGSDSVHALEDKAMFDLNGNSLARSDSDTLTLANIETANLIGGAKSGFFSVQNWTGTANLNGGAGNDTFHVTFNGVGGTVNVIGGSETDTLVVDGTSGADDISFGNTAVSRGAEVINHTAVEAHVLNTLGGSDTVTLAGGALVTVDLGSGDDQINVAAFSGNGTIKGGTGSDTLSSENDADFTVTAVSFQRAQGGVTTLLALEGIESASIQGGASANSIAVSGFSELISVSSLGGNDHVMVSGGATTLVQGGDGNDAIFVTSDGTITLQGGADDDIVTVAGEGSLDADLGAGDDQAIVSNFTGTGIIKGGLGSNTINSDNDADFTLTPSFFHRVQAGVTTELGLEAFASAQIQGGASANTISVSGFSAAMAVSALGGDDDVTISGGALAFVQGGEGDDTIHVTSDGLIQIKGEGGHDAISVAGSGTLAVYGEASVGVFAAGNDTFDVSAHTGSGFIDGGTGINTLVARGSGKFLLTDGAFTHDVLGGTSTLALASIHVANLTGGESDDSFDVGGFHGSGTLNGGAGLNVVAATGDSDFELTQNKLTRSGGTGGLHGDLTLANVHVANLTGGASANTFTVTGWDGYGTITGVEPDGVKDTVIYQGDTNIRLSDHALTAFRMETPFAPTGPVLQGHKTIKSPAYGVGFLQEGIDMNLDGVSRAIVTGGAHKNVLDAGDYSGEVTLIGGAEIDILIAGTGNSHLYGNTPEAPNGNVDPVTKKPTDKTNGFDHFYVRDNPDGMVEAVIYATTRVGNTIHFRDSGVAVDYTLPKVGKLNKHLEFTKNAPTGEPVFVDLAHTFSVALAGGYLSHAEGSKYDDRLKGNNVSNSLWGGAGTDKLIAVGGDFRFGGDDGVADLFAPKSKSSSLDADPINTAVARQRVFLISESGTDAGLPTVARFYYAPAVKYYESNSASENLLAQGEVIYELRTAPRADLYLGA